jgi:hypothetical protein
VTPGQLPGAIVKNATFVNDLVASLRNFCRRHPNLEADRDLRGLVRRALARVMHLDNEDSSKRAFSNNVQTPVCDIMGVIDNDRRLRYGHVAVMHGVKPDHVWVDQGGSLVVQENTSWYAGEAFYPTLDKKANGNGYQFQYRAGTEVTNEDSIAV